MRPRDRAGLRAEFDERASRKCEPRLIESVELLEDQQRDRLAEIERRLADGAEQVAGVKFGNPRADLREIRCGHHDGRL